jgi:hypothetical protein
MFLTSALHRDKWPASFPGRFILGQIAPATPWILRLGEHQSWPECCRENNLFMQTSKYGSRKRIFLTPTLFAVCAGTFRKLFRG